MPLYYKNIEVFAVYSEKLFSGVVKMFIKRFAAVIAAALTVAASAPAAFAEYGYDPSYDYNTYDYNTKTGIR